jgi:hypothetical protein
MAKNEVFIERREEGDYAVRKPGSERASAVLPTQAEAVERAREMHPDAAFMLSASATPMLAAGTSGGNSKSQMRHRVFLKNGPAAPHRLGSNFRSWRSF